MLKNTKHPEDGYYNQYEHITEEKIYCYYCRNELTEKNVSIINPLSCRSCNVSLAIYQHINTKSYLNGLNFEDRDVISLLEAKYAVDLQILDNNNIYDFSRQKIGIFIKKQDVIGISLDNVKFDQFPDEIYYFKNLKYLSIVNGSITKIPSSIRELKNLKSLNLRSNPLEFLPDSFTELYKLRKLSLNNTQLRLLPDLFGNLKELRWLDLDRNYLYALPESFSELQNLIWLSIFHNQVKHIPKSFYKLPLKQFGIGGNPISTKSVLKKLTYKGCEIYSARGIWNQVKTKAKLNRF